MKYGQVGVINLILLQLIQLNNNRTFQTDVTVNGASSPIDSANAIKRQQENSLVFMARGAKGAFIG